MNDRNYQTNLSVNEKDDLHQRVMKLRYSMIYEYKIKNVKNNLLMFIMD